MVALAHPHPSFPSSQSGGGRVAARVSRNVSEVRPGQVARSDAQVMAEERWVVSQFRWRSSQNSDHSFVSEAQQIIKSASGVPQLGDRTKRQIERAARATGLGYWQAFDLWYGKASAKAAELFVHRVKNNAASAAETLAAARVQENNDARIELAILKARIAEIEERVARMGDAPPA